MSKSRKLILPMVPLRDLIVFPYTILPLLVGRDKSVKAIKESLKNFENKVFLVAQKNEIDNNPSPENIYKVGIIAQIVKMIKTDNNTIKIIVEGIERAKIIKYTKTDDYNEVEIEKIEMKSKDEITEKAYIRSLLNTFNEYAQFKDNIPSEIIMSVKSVSDPSKLIDILIANLDLRLKEKQNILEIFDIIERMDNLLKLIRSEIDILKLEKRINDGVKDKIEYTRKKMLLNEKMEVIKKELGNTDDFNDEILKIKNKLKEKELPEEVREKAFEELNKLKFMSPMVAESTVIKNYLDWIIAIPWAEATDEKNTLLEAEKILNEDHYGIEKIKERILEFLAVKKLTSKSRGSILCFAGPPGVGKTSLARSIARATGRKYVKIALGGLKDESEIRGHRKTYIGAMPGRIIQSLKKAKVNNPVFLLDEIDKIGSGAQGDPSSALLEVLDPEQNVEFQDNFIGLDYDLSNVFFITTANNLQMIPHVLRDRLEIINLSSYTDEEKLEIAKRYLVKRAKEDNGLKAYKIKIEDSVLKRIIRNYTKESGVRNLEREISKVFRKIAKKVLMDDLSKSKLIKVNTKNLTDYLGKTKFTYEKKEKTSLIGVASGLAWTSVGGEILKIEVMVIPGKGKIQITGKLGDVMVESAKAALTYVRSQAKKYGLAEDFYEKNDIHIHVPEGAIPKDGPSAGITISTALLSAFIKKPVDSYVAMTGEITLRGFVSPIGGLKEKLLAAYRAGIKKVIIPSENEKDLEEIPEIVKKSLEIIPVKQVNDVWKIAILN